MEIKYDITDFAIEKLIQCLLFNTNEFERIKNGDYDKILFNETFLIHLENFVQKMNELDYLEREQINRLLDIISYIRFDKSYDSLEEKKRCYDIYNKLIDSINLMEGRNIEDFYLGEIERRFFERHHITLTEEEYEFRKFVVQASMGFDYIVLRYGLEKVSEEQFDKNIDGFANNICYFLSLNSLVLDKPELLNSIILVKRIKKVVEKNKIKDDEISSIEKKYVLKFNRFYNRNLKGE